MNVDDIRKRVERQFGDESGVQINTDDVTRWINDGMLEIAAKNHILESVGTSDLTAGDAEYPIPSKVLSIWTIKVDGFKVKYLSFEEANATVGEPDDYTKFPSGQPTMYWIWGKNIILYPNPDKTLTGGLKIYFTKKPTPVATGTDVPELPLEYHPRLVEYCLAQAYELDEDLEFAQMKSGQFSSGLLATLEDEKWSNREFYPRITVLPEDS